MFGFVFVSNSVLSFLLVLVEVSVLYILNNLIKDFSSIKRHNGKSKKGISYKGEYHDQTANWCILLEYLDNPSFIVKLFEMTTILPWQWHVVGKVSASLIS